MAFKGRGNVNFKGVDSHKASKAHLNKIDENVQMEYDEIDYSVSTDVDKKFNNSNDLSFEKYPESTSSNTGDNTAVFWEPKTGITSGNIPDVVTDPIPGPINLPTSLLNNIKKHYYYTGNYTYESKSSVYMPYANEQMVLDTADIIAKLETYRNDPTGFANFSKSEEYQKYRDKYGLDDYSFENIDLMENYLNRVLLTAAINVNERNYDMAVSKRDDLIASTNFESEVYQVTLERYDKYYNEIKMVRFADFFDGVYALTSKLQNDVPFSEDAIDYYATMLSECFKSFGEEGYSKEDIIYIIKNEPDKAIHLYDKLRQLDDSVIYETLAKYDPIYKAELADLKESYNALLANQDINNIDDLIELKNTVDAANGLVYIYETRDKQYNKMLSNLYYQSMTLSPEYQNFDFFKYDDPDFNADSLVLKETFSSGVTINSNIFYGYSSSLGISPVDYIYAVTSKNGYDPFSSNKEVFKNGGAIRELMMAGEIEPRYLNEYQFVYYTLGEEEADKYLMEHKEEMRQVIAQYNTQNKLKAFHDGEGDKYVFVDPITHEEYTYDVHVDNGKLIFDSTCEGFGSFFKNMVAWLNTDSDKSVDEWEQCYFAMSLLTTEEKEGLGLIVMDENGNKVSATKYLDFMTDYSQNGWSKFEHEFFNEVGNMLPLVLIGALTDGFGTIGASSITVSSVVCAGFTISSYGGAAYRNARLSGNDLVTSYIYGLAEGGSAAALSFARDQLTKKPLSSEELSFYSKQLIKIARNKTQSFAQSKIDALIEAIILGDTDTIEAITNG